MPLPRSGKERRCLPTTGNALIHRPVVHLVRIAESVGMVARIVGETCPILHESRGGALENLILLISSASENFIRLLQILAACRT